VKYLIESPRALHRCNADYEGIQRDEYYTEYRIQNTEQGVEDEAEWGEEEDDDDE
jgi:hypothetical protein